jgi:biotin carboxyl carrier protein
MIYEVTIAEKTYRVELVQAGTGWRCSLDGREVPLDMVSTQNNVLSILVDGKSYEVKQANSASEASIVVGHEPFVASVRDPRSFRSRRGAGTTDHGIKKITAPMPGKVVRILAVVGAEVEVGQSVIVIEAMKMQNELKAPKKGVIKKLSVTEGATVEAGQALAEVE